MVSDVGGNTGANGLFIVTSATEGGGNTAVVLADSVGNAAYTSGGVCGVPITIIYGTTLIDSSTGYEHEIIVGVDSSSATRIFIDTSSNYAGTWLELTEKMTGTVDDASIAVGDVAVIVSATMTENGNTLDLTDAVRFPDDYFKGWIVYNSTRTNYAYVSAWVNAIVDVFAQTDATLSIVTRPAPAE